MYYTIFLTKSVATNRRFLKSVSIYIILEEYIFCFLFCSVLFSLIFIFLRNIYLVLYFFVSHFSEIKVSWVNFSSVLHIGLNGFKFRYISFSSYQRLLRDVSCNNEKNPVLSCFAKRSFA